MNLTPLDVRRKEFDKAFRGYDPTEVDLFLKQVAQRLEELQEDARRAEERSRDSESKLVHYEKVELALQEALESARETARSTAASAGEKARMIVQEAELRAETILRDAERERHGLRQDIVRLSSRQAEAAARLRGFLLSELEVLAQFQGDDPVGFLKLQPAGPAGMFPPSPARLEAPIHDPGEHVTRDHDQGTSDGATWSPEAPPQSLDAPPEPAEPVPVEDWRPPVPAPEPYPDAQTEPVATTPINAPLAPEAAPPTQAPPTQAPPAETPATGAYASAPDPAEDAPPEPPAQPAVTGGWDLRSLVTGEERSVAASDEERERIRRILDDLD